MTREEIIEELESVVGLIKQDGKDWLDERDIPLLGSAIEALGQEPCEDAVSSQMGKEQMIKYGFHAPDITVTEFVEDLPSVTPMQKMGQWLYGEYMACVEGEGHYRAECSECHSVRIIDNYCPNCGTIMEVEE